MKADIIEALVVYFITAVILIGGWTIVAEMISRPNTTAVFLGAFLGLAWLIALVVSVFLCVRQTRNVIKHFQSP